MKYLKELCKVVCSTSRKSYTGRIGSRHHKSAISDGLRMGSSKSGSIMANWRWKEHKK